MLRYAPRRSHGIRLAFAALAGFIGAIATGCISPIPAVDPQSPPFHGRSQPELQELELGRSHYIAKCSGCHSLYLPSRGDAVYWRGWVDKMAERAAIAPEERQRILSYLGVVCAPPVAARVQP